MGSVRAYLSRKIVGRDDFRRVLTLVVMLMREEGLVKEAHGQAAPSAEKVALILDFLSGASIIHTRLSTSRRKRLSNIPDASCLSVRFELHVCST